MRLYNNFKLIRYFIGFICYFLFSCGFKPADEGKINKFAFIEYDYLNSSNIKTYVKCDEGFNKLETPIRRMFNFKDGDGFFDHRTSVKIIFSSGGILNEPIDPQTGNRWNGLFSKLSENYEKMMLYSQCHRTPNNWTYSNTANPDLESIIFPYHFLSIDRCLENNPSGSSISAGLSSGSEKGYNIPNDRHRRFSYVYLNDIIDFYSGNWLDSRNFIIFATAHELGHQLLQLTDEDDEPQFHQGYEYDIMKYPAKETFLGVTGSNYIDYYFGFCHNPDDTPNSCIEFFRLTNIDTIKYEF